MKTKFIVASTIWLLWIASVVFWATTFAANTWTANMWYGSWAKIVRDRDDMMGKFTTTWDAQAFKTAIDTAMKNNDYTAFVAAHTKYSITKYMTKDQFTTMVVEMAKQAKIKTALLSWDYATWKTLNEGNPILTKIDTEVKFQKLQEIETYREKIDALNTDLGLGELKGEGNGMGMWFDVGKWMEKWMKWWMDRWIGWWRWEPNRPMNGSWTSQ